MQPFQHWVTMLPGCKIPGRAPQQCFSLNRIWCTNHQRKQTNNKESDAFWNALISAKVIFVLAVPFTTKGLLGELTDVEGPHSCCFSECKQKFSAGLLISKGSIQIANSCIKNSCTVVSMSESQLSKTSRSQLPVRAADELRHNAQVRCQSRWLKDNLKPLLPPVVVSFFYLIWKLRPWRIKWEVHFHHQVWGSPAWTLLQEAGRGPAEPQSLLLSSGVWPKS